MKKDTRDFQTKVKLGNDKEDLLVEKFILNDIPAKLNNVENVKDIDIQLTFDNLYVDCKYLESVYLWSKQHAGIDPENCLLINKTHIDAYAKKESDTNNRTWVAFNINFKQFGINEYRFFPNSYFVHHIKKGSLKVNNNKVNIDRTKGYSFDEFKKYINDLRIIKKQK